MLLWLLWLLLALPFFFSSPQFPHPLIVALTVSAFSCFLSLTLFLHLFASIETSEGTAFYCLPAFFFFTGPFFDTSRWTHRPSPPVPSESSPDFSDKMTKCSLLPERKHQGACVVKGFYYFNGLIHSSIILTSAHRSSTILTTRSSLQGSLYSLDAM